MKHVIVSIINFNGKKNTIECLKSLARIKHDRYRITTIVVDNASKEKFEFDNLNSDKTSKVIMRSNENLGFSGGHNLTIKYALGSNADYVLILNNDTYVDENFIDELLNVAEKDPAIGVCVPKIYFAPGFEYHKNRYLKTDLGKVFWYAGGDVDWANVSGYHRGVDEVDNSQYDSLEETNIATGCCMLVKREVFNLVGLLDEKYFLYYEDSDFSMRLKRRGFRIMYVPKSVVWHKNAGSAGGSGSLLQDYYITRNRLIFGFRYAPIRSKFALFRESLGLLLKGRRWQKQAIVDYYLGRLGKGSYNS